MNSWPYFDKNEIAKAKEILESGKINYWTGMEGREFEKEFSSYNFEILSKSLISQSIISTESPNSAFNLASANSPLSGPRLTIITRNPALAMPLHISKPIPELPPVMIHIFLVIICTLSLV